MGQEQSYSLYLTDDKSCIPDVQYYLCVELYRNAWEKDGEREAGGGGGGGVWERRGVTLGAGRWGGGGTSAQLLN